MDAMAYLDTINATEMLTRVYGADFDAQRARYKELVARHRALFGQRERLTICSAPGRAEIAGNHTDHNHGRVLAAAVSLDTVICAAPNESNVVTLYSEGYTRPFVVDLAGLAAVPEEQETSLSLIRGVAARMRELGYAIGGFDGYVQSTVFKGSGLSSSAAFEVMLVAAFDALYNGFVIDAPLRALISKYAENHYFGKPSGLLDQMSSSVGGLVTMDFKTEDAVIEPLSYDFGAKGYALCVVSAGGEHGNLTAEYATMPMEMKQVAAQFGKDVLREVEPETMEQAIPRLKNKVPDRAILRALHFYDEDRRVPVLVDALKRDDLETFLQGIIASGESSWKLLQNLYVPGRENQEMALALELSRRMLENRGAWRIHGGGFAGTILAFVPYDLLDAYRARMNAVFGENACTVLSVRPIGAMALPLYEG